MTQASISAARHSIIAVAVALGLCGCGNPYYPIGPGPETVRLTGWIGNAASPPVQPVHCFATLAGPDCYAAPQPGISNRWLGSYVSETERR